MAHSSIHKKKERFLSKYNYFRFHFLKFTGVELSKQNKRTVNMQNEQKWHFHWSYIHCYYLVCWTIPLRFCCFKKYFFFVSFQRVIFLVYIKYLSLDIELHTLMWIMHDLVAVVALLLTKIPKSRPKPNGSRIKRYRKSQLTSVFTNDNSKCAQTRTNTHRKWTKRQNLWY